ncbi:polyphosphate polymerase domain-containing protein [Christensenellaceae bacterium OttesenSCG-928-M15]|nr:polyphosphate polymerase domain-containing protein [Christensenellaceae bacterium OttesenSCG-928-M15]
MKNNKPQTTFERMEKKYVLQNDQYFALLKRLQPYMQGDDYGLHTICSLYFDTDDYRIIRHSLDKPLFKEKLRLRSYGVPKPTDNVFLELKKKYDGITYKRRIALTLREAHRYLISHMPPRENGQVFREIDSFINQYAPAPKVLLCYDRLALYGIDDPSLRITFDANIRYRQYQLDLLKGDHGAALLSPDQRIMEIKIHGAFPLWLSNLLTELQIYPSSYSKYGRVFQDYVLQEQEAAHVG